MPIQTIASDLDGTLLNGAGRLSAVNEAAVRAAKESGMDFIIATGRPLRWLGVIEDVLHLASHVIANNGALTLDANGHVLWTAPIDARVLSEVLDDLTAVLPVGLAVEYSDGWARNPAFTRSNSIVDDIINPLGQLPTDDVWKLLVWSPTLDTVSLHAAVSEVVGDRLTCTWSFFSSDGLVELSAPGVSKASALVRLLDHLGRTPSGLAVFGDMPNDVEMLRLAGHGFVPANAHPDLIAEGFEVVGHHDDDGVGRAIMGLLEPLN